jgi:hypothetical protein
MDTNLCVKIVHTFACLSISSQDKHAYAIVLVYIKWQRFILILTRVPCLTRKGVLYTSSY